MSTHDRPQKTYELLEAKFRDCVSLSPVPTRISNARPRSYSKKRQDSVRALPAVLCTLMRSVAAMVVLQHVALDRR